MNLHVWADEIEQLGIVNIIQEVELTTNGLSIAPLIEYGICLGALVDDRHNCANIRTDLSNGQDEMFTTSFDINDDEAYYSDEGIDFFSSAFGSTFVKG